MEMNGLIHKLPNYAKALVVCFVLTLGLGFFSGYKFLFKTGATNPSGVESNYLGNEDDEDAEEMAFKMSEHEILTIIHTHSLSMSMIFFCLGVLICITSIPPGIKKILVVEPFVSIFATFGGIWIMWCGVTWFSYIVMISGMLMCVSVVAQILVILQQVFKSE